jgi:hypothetical protein
MNSKIFTNSILVIIAILVGVGTFGGIKRQAIDFGSTVVGNDYTGTTTRNYAGTEIANYSVLKTGPGALARVTITGANTGVINIWNATTTNVSLRAASMASTTILLAQFPASAAAGTYDFDLDFNNGLLYEVVSGSAPTTTLMWR